MMTKDELLGIWNYYLSLENDLANTSRYIEPMGQENVHSFEFAKLIILACTEVESAFKILCQLITGHQVSGDIGTYKATILGKYPKIITATVSARRLGKDIAPFTDWNNGKLNWWESYQHVKHNRGSYFGDATYINAVQAISALYILTFYVAKSSNLCFPDHEATYLSSNYAHPGLLCAPDKELPDFEEVSDETTI